MNRTTHCLQARAPEGGERGGSKEDMVYAGKGGVETEDLPMAESMTPTTMAMPGPNTTQTGTAMGIGIEPANETEAAVPND